jgi:hypothetical protein
MGENVLSGEDNAIVVSSSPGLFSMGETVPDNPFGENALPTDAGALGYNAMIDFARRFGLARVGQTTNQLAEALKSPAEQLKKVNEGYARITAKLANEYNRHMQTMYKAALPDDEIRMRADAFIRPRIASELDMLRLQLPFAVGGMAQGQLNPLAMMATGMAGAEYKAGGEFKNLSALRAGVGGVTKNKWKKKYKKWRKRRRANKRKRKGGA